MPTHVYSPYDGFSHARLLCSPLFDLVVPKVSLFPPSNSRLHCLTSTPSLMSYNPHTVKPETALARNASSSDQIHWGMSSNALSYTPAPAQVSSHSLLYGTPPPWQRPAQQDYQYPFPMPNPWSGPVESETRPNPPPGFPSFPIFVPNLPPPPRQQPPPKAQQPPSFKTSIQESLRALVDDEPDLTSSDPTSLPQYAFMSQVLSDSCIAPGNYVRTALPHVIVHLAPTENSWTELQFKYDYSFGAMIHNGAYPSIKAPTFVIITSDDGTLVFRYSGNRKRKLMTLVPELLVACHNCRSRAEILAMLMIAGVEQNPGWIIRYWLTIVIPSNVIGITCTFLVPYPFNYVASVLIASCYVLIVTQPRLVAQFCRDVATYIADGAALVAALARNALIHALNGNTTQQARRTLNSRAFAWDPADPQTWKFDPADALAFTKAVRDSQIVRDNTIPWVTEKLLMRRGVRLSEAFMMIRERYASKPPGFDTRFVNKSNVVKPHKLPPQYLPGPYDVIPDVNKVTAAKIAFSEPLTSRDRRALMRVTKQSGIKALIPDLGLSSSISSAFDTSTKRVEELYDARASRVDEVVASHIATLTTSMKGLSDGLVHHGESIENGFKNLSHSLLASTTDISDSLRNVTVDHTFSPFSSNKKVESSEPYVAMKDLSAAPSPLRDFLDLLTDCLPMIVSDDPLVALALQPSLLRRHSFLTVALCDALILFVKKLIKLTQSEFITKQGNNQIIDEGVASMLYSVGYALIFQQLPPLATGTFKDRVIGLNALATLAKNAISLSNFLVEAFKYVVDWIYENLTGQPYYNTVTRDHLFHMAKVTCEAERLLALTNVTPSNLEDMTRLRQHAAQVLARASTDVKIEKQCAVFKRMISNLASYQGEISADVELTHGRPATTLIRLVGAGGVGKTTCIDYIVSALHVLMKWPGTSALNQIQYDYDVNFQSKLSASTRVLIIDDPFVVQNEDVIKKVLAEIYALGNSRPKKREGAAIDDKDSMYEHIELGIITDMGARADLPNNNEEGLARRFTGGQFDHEVNKAFRTPPDANGKSFLDVDKITPHNLDEVWCFRSRTDQNIFRFWDVVYNLYHVMTRTKNLYARRTTFGLTIEQIASEQEIRHPAKIKIGRNFVKSVTTQAFLTQQERYALVSQSALSQSMADILAASLDKEKFSDYTLPVLASELGAEIDAKDTIDYLAKYADKFMLLKGKEKEKPVLDLASAPDADVLKTVKVRGPCCWLDQECAEHGKTCSSRMFPPEPKPAWWIRSQLARLPKFALPSWMIAMYDKLCQYGYLVPTVPTIITQVLTYLSSQVVIVGVGMLFSATLGYFFTARMATQSYSTTYAQVPRRSGQALPGVVKPQVHLTTTKPDNDDWLKNKVAMNTVALALPAMRNGKIIHKSANLFCVESNLHLTTKHVFIDDPLVGYLCLFGDAAITYPLRKVEFLGWDQTHPVDDSLSCAWWIPIPGLDLVYVITPRSGLIRPDLTSYIAPEGTPINTLTDVAIVLRPSHENEIDETKNFKVVKTSNPAAFIHAAGDVISMGQYNIEGSPLGLYARCPNRTPDGSCGSAWFTRNTRVGKGSAKIFAIQGAYADSQELAIGVPLSNTLLVALKSLLPPRKLNIAMSGRETPDQNGGTIAANVVAMSTLPTKQGAIQNLRNTIKRSPAHDVLSGVEVLDPRTKESILIPPPFRIPVDLRGPAKALQKMPLTVDPWPDQQLQDYREAGKYVSQRLLAEMDQRFIDRLYVPTRKQVINGDPALDIPGIDMTTSAGWFPGNKLPGKEAYFHVDTDGLWDLRPEWVGAYNEILEDLRDGKVPEAFVVDNGKPELRPPAKCMRNTSAYQALLLTAVKEILYWFPVLVKYGRIRNQTLYGVDLNSSEGEAVKLKLDRHPHGNQGDYSNYDATIGPEQDQVVAEDVVTPVMARIRHHGACPHSDQTIRAAARTQTLTYHIFGTVIYMRYFGNTSGGFITTPYNCCIGSTNYAYSWLVYHRAQGYTRPVWVMYEECNEFLCYGDDYDATTSDDGFDNFHFEKVVTTLGQKVTPALKGTAFLKHVNENGILKRHPSMQRGKIHWLLEIEVLAEIHAFIRDATVSTISATRTNMDTALREWYHYGEYTFEKVKGVFNDFLATRGASPLLLSYTDLDREFLSGRGDLTTFSAVTKQSTILDLRCAPSANRPVTRKVTRNRIQKRRSAAQVLQIANPIMFMLLILCMPYTRIATPSISHQDSTSSTTPVGAPRSNEDPISGRTAITSTSDDTSVTQVTPPAVVAPIVSRVDPYPDQGMGEVLSRQYRISDVSWTPASAHGTLLYSARFPDEMFNIPNISEKLRSFRYLRAGVKVSLRINANAFAGGTLMIGTLPFYDPSAPTAWRHKFWTLAQSGVTLLSASKADTVEITIPWIAPLQFHDLRSTAYGASIGSIFVYVLNPLVFSNTGAPSNLSVSIFASFVTPTVAGPDINGAPAFSVSKQSGEAMVKSLKGVIAGVAKATSTVTAMVRPFADMLPLGFLDKPTSLAANQPFTSVPARGMSQSSGLDLSTKLSLDPEAQVSVDDSIFGGSKSKPSWAEVLGNPGLILVTTMNQTQGADSLIASWPVRPNYARSTGGTVFFPCALAYYSMFWRRWRGSIKYMIHFACPSNVTCRVRISFLPNVDAATAPPENQAGDVFSKIVSITGDTVVLFPVEYLADTYMKNLNTLSTSDLNNDAAVGRVTISVLNEVVSVNSAAVTPVGISIWMGAGPNMVFSMPDDFPDGWAPDFAVGVTKQCSVREMFAKPAEGIVPTTLLQEKGIVTPEAFTGPLDLLHRNTYQGDNTSGDAWLVEPQHGTSAQYILLPFLGWRGAWRYKIYPRAAYTDKIYIVRWDPTDTGIFDYNSGAQIFKADTVSEFECPYYDQYAWRETWPIMSVNSRDRILIDSETPGTFITWESVGDDFSLGPLCGPPPLRYTAPPSGVSPPPEPVKKGLRIR